jgi:hypothetical protein
MLTAVLKSKLSKSTLQILGYKLLFAIESNGICRIREWLYLLSYARRGKHLFSKAEGVCPRRSRMWECHRWPSVSKHGENATTQYWVYMDSSSDWFRSISDFGRGMLVSKAQNTTKEERSAR